jgi:hypothetical protein
MSQGYFVLRVSDDGDVSFDGPLSSDELRKRITPDDDGETYYGRRIGFADSVPGFLGLLDGRILIVKGEVVVPQPVQTVTEYKLP